MGVGETLTRPVGPLPVWGWAAVGVGGFVVYRVVRGGIGGSSSSGQLIPYDTSGGSAGGGGGSSSDGSNSSNTPSTATDNSAITAALRALQDQISALAGQQTPSGSGTDTGNNGGPGTGGDTSALSSAQAAVTKYQAAVDKVKARIAELSKQRQTAAVKHTLAGDRALLAKDQGLLANAQATLSTLQHSAGVIPTDQGSAAGGGSTGGNRQATGTAGAQGAGATFDHIVRGAYAPIGNWGDPIDLTSPATDTYIYAQQWYYALLHPEIAQSSHANPVFQQVNNPGAIGYSGNYGQFQLGQLVGSLIGSGTRYTPNDVYPVIPKSVISAGGSVVPVAAQNAAGSILPSGNYSARPEASNIPGLVQFTGGLQQSVLTPAKTPATRDTRAKTILSKLTPTPKPITKTAPKPVAKATPISGGKAAPPKAVATVKSGTTVPRQAYTGKAL